MMQAQIIPHLPTSVNLHYVDYRDDLSEHTDLLEETLRQNCLDPIYEKVNDWWIDSDSTSYYIEEIQNSLGKSSDYQLTDDDRDEIRDWLYDNDTSDPTKELLGNTGKLTMFYSLGLEIDGYSEAGFFSPSMRYSSEAQEAYKIRRKLGIQKGTKEAELIDSIVANASYGGELRIYFSLDLEDALSGESDKDFRQIQFKGRYAIAVYHSNGSGDFEYMEIDRTFPFDRDNLFTSDADSYSIESCFGMCSDWLDKTTSPVMSVEPLKKKQRIAKSKNREIHAREAEYKRIFKAGGCTAGDMDINRHRDVSYSNDFPCGSRCPHCGTFWID